MADDILSREQARALGWTRYFTGKPCKHGHVAQRDVINATCVECTLGWKRRNPERVKQYSRDYHAENREERLAYAKVYRQTEAGKATQQRMREKHKEKRKAAYREWRAANIERARQATRDWRARNWKPPKPRHKFTPEEIRQRTYAWRRANKAWVNGYSKRRRKHDLNYRIAAYLRSGIATAIIRGRKSGKAGSAVGDLGCSMEEFKAHITSQFDETMTWENRGVVWQLDHIQPLAAFDLTDRKQFLMAVHYTNLRPLSIELHKIKNKSEKKLRHFKQTSTNIGG